MEERVIIPVGDIRLEGLLSLPAAAARTGAVVCHPHPLYGGEMHNSIASALVDGFRAAGFATLRFNFRGVGASTGAHDNGNAEQHDVAGAVTLLLERSGLASVAVAGYSFGSMVGLRAGAADPRVGKLVGVALPIASRDASFLLGAAKPTLLIGGDRDAYSPVAGLRKLCSGIPGALSPVVIAGADHFFGGREAEVAAAATAFLAA